MEPQVVAAIVSTSGTAIVAAIGIIGTALSQKKAAQQARDDASSLFKMQAENERSLRQEEIAEQRRRDFLAERQRSYVRLMSAGDQYSKMKDVHEQARSKMDQAQTDDRDGDYRTHLAETLKLGQEREKLVRELLESFEAVQLLAAEPVRAIATKWVYTILNDEPVDQVSKDFRQAVRTDLGVDA